MVIETVRLPGQLALAPMAGVTDLAFRHVCRTFGASLTYTEMVSSKGLVFRDKKTATLLEKGEGETPMAAQIFGSDPDTMAEAARIALELSGAEIIDINMGCPMPKIVNSGDGSALMKDIGRAEKVILSVRKAVKVPVTVKFRLGWDKGSKNYLEFADMCESAGAAALCIHGRTRTQMYSGQADWFAIAEVKRQAKIPVIANGDIMSGDAAVRALRITGADMLMIGRGAMGNPWIFREIAGALKGEVVSPPTVEERCGTVRSHIMHALRHKPEKVVLLEARKHMAWYLKGLPHSRIYKDRIFSLSSVEDLISLLERIRSDPQVNLPEENGTWASGVFKA